MREMSLSDSRVTIEERMSDTYEDMKETGTKAKQRLGQLSSGFMKKVDEAKLGEKSTNAINTVKATTAKYSEEITKKVKDVKVNEKLAGVTASAAVLGGSLAMYTGKLRTSFNGMMTKKESAGEVADADTDAATKAKAEKSTASVVEGEDDEEDEEDEAEAQPGDPGSAAGKEAEGGEHNQDPASQQEGAPAAGGVRTRLASALSGVGSYVSNVQVKANASKVSDSMARVTSVSKEALMPAWTASVIASKALAQKTKAAGEVVKERGAVMGSGTWEDLKDFTAFMANDFRDFSSDMEESVSYLTTAGAQLYSGNKMVPANGAAVFLGSIEEQWNDIDSLQASNDIKLQASQECLRKLVVTWMKNREHYDTCEAELKALPLVADQIKSIGIKVDCIMESLAVLEDSLAEAEEVAHAAVLQAKQKRFEAEFKANEEKHRSQLVDWEARQAVWAAQAAEGRKKWSQEQEEAVATLEEQLAKEAAALVSKAATAQAAKEQGYRSKIGISPYGTISDVPLSLSQEDNRLISRRELDAFYKDEDVEDDRYRRRRQNSKRREEDRSAVKSATERDPLTSSMSPL